MLPHCSTLRGFYCDFHSGNWLLTKNVAVNSSWLWVIRPSAVMSQTLFMLGMKLLFGQKGKQAFQAKKCRLSFSPSTKMLNLIWYPSRAPALLSLIKRLRHEEDGLIIQEYKEVKTRSWEWTVGAFLWTQALSLKALLALFIWHLVQVFIQSSLWHRKQDAQVGTEPQNLAEFVQGS